METKRWKILKTISNLYHAWWVKYKMQKTVKLFKLMFIIFLLIITRFIKIKCMTNCICIVCIDNEIE